jgi:hypothetical protein
MNCLIRKSISAYFLLLLGNVCVLAQPAVRDSVASSIVMINIEYNGSMAGGDLADRFGFTSAIGGGLGYKFKSNIYLAASARYLFGGTLKEDDILDAITTAGGLIVIADNGNLAEVRLQERGWVLPFAIGRIFPLNPANQNSGLYVEIGGQFIEHRIAITMPDQEPAALSRAHKKGYDRLTNGFGLRQAAGYRFFDKRNYLNFAIGLEFSQNFTRNRRSINIDTGLRDDRSRLDLLGGIIATWTLPLHASGPKKIYYN